MNILLVYPKYPDTFWSFKHALSFISRKAAFPPLGLLTIASMLPKEWNLKLVDLNVKELEEKDIAWSDMVFISAMLVQKKSSLEIISKAKLLGKTVVAGGPVFNTQLKKTKGVDHFILGEAEITLPRFLKDLKEGKEKKIYSTKKRPVITKTPAPMWSLINFKDYATMSVQYSRGCPFDCEFCDIVIMNGRTPRTKTPEQLVNEMQTLFDAGWRGHVFIVDDNFIGNKKNVKEMLKKLIVWQKKRRYPFQLLTEASINLADDIKLMKMMSSANFSKVFLGLETPDVNSLKECSKIQNTSVDITKAVKRIQQHGMQVMGGFIVGFDTDTENIFEAQIKFIQKIGVVTAMVGILMALPKTRLWHRLKDEGRLLDNFTGDLANINFTPKMSYEDLSKGYKKIMKTIYSPKNYYKRINTFIKNYNPTSKVRLKWQDINALIKSVWKIGIISKSRGHYWKLILKTSFTKTKALPIAIELAIYGVHFQKIASTVGKVF